MVSDSSPTLGTLIQTGTQWLEARGIADARIQVEWLVAAVLSCRRTEFDLNSRISQESLTRLRNGLSRLASHEPLQYVIGEWDFRCLTLTADRRALIPRPETEQLVELLFQEKSLWQKDSPVIYDVGTGTGAIALSVAFERPQSSVTAIDCEEPALSLAHENASRVGIRNVHFVLGRNCAGAKPASVDAIISNPPYIASAVVDALPPMIRNFEPRSALDGGPDGLDVLRSLILDSAIALRVGGFIFLEIGDDQGNAVAQLLDDAGFSEVHIFSDLAGKTRFAKGRIL